MNPRFAMAGQEWNRLAPLLSAMTPRRGGCWRDHRQVPVGVLFRVHSGGSWQNLPERYGPWQTVYEWFARWQTDGTWAQIEAALRTQADVAGGTRRSIRPWCGPTSTPPGSGNKEFSAIQASRQQALGRSRGGLTTTLPTIRDGRGRTLVTRLTPGQDADASQLVGLVD